MAWVFPERRQCPSCGYTEQILLVLHRDDRFCLSCGWCAHLSEPMTPAEAVFNAWGGSRIQRIEGSSVEFIGVPHWFRGQYVESAPFSAKKFGDSVYLSAA